MRARLALVAISCLFVVSAHARINIAVNPNATIAHLNSAPVGLVLNEVMDGLLPLNTLENAVRLSGAKRLRFPEGEGADNYYWTDPSTLAAPNPATHRLANTAWWPVNTEWVDANGHYLHGLNFDQFMTVVKATGSIPNVILCYPCTDKSMALEMAKAWVKYSKDKGYDVLDWEIGNETDHYNPNFSDLYPMTVTEYAKDVIEWSAALKSIDPRIRIGANGMSGGWLRSLLTYQHPTLGAYGAQAIDFLVVHSYPMYHSNFLQYQNNHNIFGREVSSAVNYALKDLPSTINVSHVRVAVTEFGALTYIGQQRNNLGLAIMTTELALALLSQPRVDYAELWNSRYINNFAAATPEESDAFSPTNQLHPSGLALSILSRFLKNRLVNVTGATTSLRAYASVSNATGEIDLFLINRSNSAQAIKIRVNGRTNPLSSTRYSLTGAAWTGFHPAFNSKGALNSKSSTLSLTVPATSVTVLAVPAVVGHSHLGLTGAGRTKNARQISSTETSLLKAPRPGH
jgi:alpha-N-arabinofuranosidase